jgi:predicted signal transduction protein with EAL and GGDEF domain
VFPWSPEDPQEVSYQEVLRLADQALYKAKHAGRNTAVGIFYESAGCHLKERDALSDELSTSVPSARSVATSGP